MPEFLLKAKKLIGAFLCLILTIPFLMAACGDSTNPTPVASSKAIVTTATSSGQTNTPVPATARPTQSSPTTVVKLTSPIPDANGFDPDEKEVSYMAGQDRLYGTLLVPNQGKPGKKPAALIIVGSGETDRNANDPLNIYHNFARVLADQGVVSLRYDKLTTGKTGKGSYASHPQDIDFNLYVDEARAGYEYLKSRPEVDPTRVMILGHSEGGLVALALSDQLKSTGEPKALVLASSISRPVLEPFRAQLAADYAARVRGGIFTQADADDVLAEFDSATRTLLETGKFPDFRNLVLYQYFPRTTDKFFAEEARIDPSKIAAGLPTNLPVLLFCGEKDNVVSCDDVKKVGQALEKAGNKNSSFNQIPNMDHLYKDILGTPRGNADWIDPRIKYSPEANARLANFVKVYL